MKFNWGTGILVFLILFLSAATVFIIFAMRQDVNLVDEDYYEKGVEYSAQMEVDARSAAYIDSIRTYIEDGSFVVAFERPLAFNIDSGSVLMFRPSNSSLDVNMTFGPAGRSLKIPKSDLISGRYILKLSWYMEGLKYSVDKTIDIR
jgi:hypothetical protein